MSKNEFSKLDASKLTRDEKRLLKAAKKLQKASARYLKELGKIDKVIQDLPTSLTRRHLLEPRYFSQVPQIASVSVRLELLSTYIEEELNLENIETTEDWSDLID
jgi:acetyl-CoA carboxylase alpha subunit